MRTEEAILPRPLHVPKHYIAAPTFHLFRTFCRRHEISQNRAVHVTSVDQIRGLQNIKLYCIKGLLEGTILCNTEIVAWFLSSHGNNSIEYVDM